MRKLPLILASVLLLTGLTPVAEPPADPPAAPCGQPGQWLTPGQTGALTGDALLTRLAGQQVVLLGETHDNADDHRWQLHTLAALHGRQPALAIGFEMFPRRLQPVLDQWVAGRLSEAEFLSRVEWDKVWGFDAQHYLPLFHFARLHGVPMLALNVERGLVSRVESQGWDGVPEAQREGVSRPAPPAADYRRELRQIYDHHPGAKSDAGFARFTEAQTTWDRAMAEAVAGWLKRHPGHLVVGILGAGHVRFGHGVAHQLADLGVHRVAKLMTWNQDLGCEELRPGLADAVFIKQDEAVTAPPPPRLGIAMEPDPAGGVRIVQVTGGSVAEQAGLKSGDLVLLTAGRAIKDMDDLRALIRRQAPGTWLPVKVRRDGQEMELVARFPPD